MIRYYTIRHNNDTIGLDTIRSQYMRYNTNDTMKQQEKQNAIRYDTKITKAVQYETIRYDSIQWHKAIRYDIKTILLVNPDFRFP